MYKLCGGTLLVLLLHSSKNKISETSFLIDMLKILAPKVHIADTHLKVTKDKFKKCHEHSSLATPFEESSMQMKLTEDMHYRYHELLERTTKFIKNYIDTDSEMYKDALLIKALLEVIEQDNSIPDEQELYILPDGKTVKKRKLSTMTKFYLPSFLLGILYYVIMNIKDNKEGAKTYDEWCPKPDSGTQRNYAANIGENSTKQITIINSPDEYSYYELLELSVGTITIYVKQLPINDDYDIAASTIIAADNIDDSEKDNYLKFMLDSHDHEKLIEFTKDLNELICDAQKNQNSNNDEIILLGNAKSDFYYKWLYHRYNFNDNSIQKWAEFILDKVEKSEIIDINNITKPALLINPNPIVFAKPLKTKSPTPKINYIKIAKKHNNTSMEPESITTSEKEQKK